MLANETEICHLCTDSLANLPDGTLVDGNGSNI